MKKTKQKNLNLKLIFITFFVGELVVIQKL